jgi:hypothetical protein
VASSTRTSALRSICLSQLPLSLPPAIHITPVFSIKHGKRSRAAAEPAHGFTLFLDTISRVSILSFFTSPELTYHGVPQSFLSKLLEGSFNRSAFRHFHTHPGLFLHCALPTFFLFHKSALPQASSLFSARQVSIKPR